MDYQFTILGKGRQELGRWCGGVASRIYLLLCGFSSPLLFSLLHLFSIRRRASGTGHEGAWYAARAGSRSISY